MLFRSLIRPSFEMQRHYFWANFFVPPREFEKSDIRHKNKISDFAGSEIVASSNIKNKRQALRNCVNPHVGKHILDSAASSITKPEVAWNF